MKRVCTQQSFAVGIVNRVYTRSKSWNLKINLKIHGKLTKNVMEFFFCSLTKKMVEYLSKYDKIMKKQAAALLFNCQFQHYFMKTIYLDNTCFLLGRYIFCRNLVLFQSQNFFKKSQNSHGKVIGNFIMGKVYKPW